MRPHLGTHEDDVRVCSQPVDKDLHHLDQSLIGQDLKLLQQGFFTGDRLRAALAAFCVRVQICREAGELNKNKELRFCLVCEL